MGIFLSLSQSILSQNTIGWVIISIICLLLLLGLLAYITIKMYYGKLLVDFKKNYNDKTFKNNEINEIINKFKVSAEKGTDNINTEAIIERNINGSIINRERWVNMLPSFFIALGLLGTFMGLTLAIFDTKSALDSIDNINNFTMALQSPISSMASAFWTSIFGVISSVLLNSFNVRINNTKNSFYYNIEDYLDNEVYAEHATTFNTVFEEFSKTVKFTMLTLTEEMTHLFKDGVEELVNKINANSLDLTESAKALESYTVKFEELVKSLDNTIVKFDEPMDRFKTSMDNFEIISTNLTTSINNSVEKFTERLDVTSEKVGDFVNNSINMFTNNINTTVENLSTSINSSVLTLEKTMTTTSDRFRENISNIITDFSDKIENITDKAISEINNSNEKLSSSIDNSMNNFANNLNNSADNMHSTMNTVMISFSDEMNLVVDDFEKVVNNVVDNLTNDMDNTVDKLCGSVDNSIINFGNRIDTTSDKVISYVDNLLENISSKMNSIATGLGSSINNLMESFVGEVAVLEERFDILGRIIESNKESLEVLEVSISEESESLRKCYNAFDEGLQEVRQSNEIQNKEFLNQIQSINKGYEKFGEGFESFKKSLQQIEISLAKGFAGVVQSELNLLSKDFTNELDFVIRGMRKATEDLSESVNIVGDLVRATNEWVAVTTINNSNRDVEGIVSYED